MCICKCTCIFIHFKFVFKDIKDRDGTINSPATYPFQSRIIAVEMTCCALKEGRKRRFIWQQTYSRVKGICILTWAEFFPYRIKYELDSSPPLQLPPYHWWLVWLSMWENCHISYFTHSYWHASGTCLTCGLNFDVGVI